MSACLPCLNALPACSACLPCLNALPACCMHEGPPQKIIQMYHKLHELVAEGCDDMQIYHEKVFKHSRPMQEKYRQKTDTAKALVRTIKKGAKNIEDKKIAEPKT